MALTGLWSRATGAIVGFAIGQSAADATRPTFELIRQEAWHGNPNRVLGMTELARLVATGITSYDAAVDQAQREGFDSNRFRAMVEYYINPPQYGYAFQALQRGDITEKQFRHLLTKNAVEGQFHDALVKLRYVLPSVTDMVRFAVREVFNPSQREILDLDAEFPEAFAAAADKIGIAGPTARDYWAAHWELPSYGQASQMLFRGEIDRTKFRALLKALDYAPTWRGPLEAIARAIPTITDFQRLVRRGIYAGDERQRFEYDAEYPAAFTEKMALHGMSEADARDLWAGGWRLPSARQLYVMRWRDEITDGDLNDGLKALDYPKFWRPRLFNISHIEPGRIDLKRFLRHGILNRDQVKLQYQRIGYTVEHSEWMTQVAEAELGTDTTGMPTLAKAESRLYTVAHNEYLDGSIDEAIARGILSELNVPDGEQTLVLALWDSEAAISRLELTPTQVKKAFTSGRYTLNEAIAELQERGMTIDDANDFLQS